MRIIKTFRNDSVAKNDLKEIVDCTAYSVITHLELLVGASTQTKKEAVMKTGYPLITYNKKDFDFIEGIKFYK